MKKLSSLLPVLAAALISPLLRAQPLHYTLLAESHFIDDCLICGRPTIAVPLRGTFTLVPDEITPISTRYRMENIAWVGGWGTNVLYDVRGSGTYTVGGEVAITKHMVLNVTVNGSDLVFTNDGLPSLRGFPDYVIDTSLAQTQQNFVAYYSMDLLATPLREAWFSTTRAISNAGPGDLLSTSGRIVKSNRDLVSQLGFMPVVGHLGVDAVEIAPGGRVWFSLNESGFSETLGEIDHGDILSPEGRIVRKYYDLIGPFFIPVGRPADYGLDALHVSDSGKVLFSVRSNFFATKLNTNVGHGDLLTEDGQIFRSNAELLQKFQPLTTKDHGLDGIHVWPSGEIWFSITEGFDDQQRGAIEPGDILSEAGYIALRNRDLLQKFGADDQQDFGADALFVVTDLSVAGRPRFSPITRGIHLRWEGPGRVFQVEKTAALTRPFLSVSPIMPDAEWLDTLTGNTTASGFYRVRQW